MLAPRPLALAFALICAAGLTCAAAAEPTLSGVNLGAYASGPKVKASDLKGRVVVFEYWGNTCPPCLKAIPHVAGLQEKYPYEALIVIANQCWDGSPAETGKIWADHKGGAKVAVIHQGGLRGAVMNGVPHAFVFDAKGKCVFNGYPTSMDAAVAKAVKESPAGQAIFGAQAKAKEIFGDDIPDTLMKTALLAADTKRSCESSLKQLNMVATRAKDKALAGKAKAMVDSFNTFVSKKYADGLALEKTDPAEAYNALETLTKWAPQTPENLKAREQIAKWRRDAAFLKALAADKAWLKLKEQADKIDFENHPKAQPSSQLERDLKKFLADKDFADTKALEKVKAAAPDWKLDPETGRADKFKANAK